MPAGRNMGKEIIILDKVTKRFGGSEVVKGIDLTVYEGEFLTLLGPSGCGKTTTLRMIAGFEEVSSGSIYIDGACVNAEPPYRRSVNTVFQNYALFPLMNVYDNIAYGLTIKKLSRKEIKDKVMDALRTVQLDGFEKRRVKQLSGGQKQRVAIARALVNDPKVLLLDEPLGALDFKLRKQMQLELKRLQKQLNITFIYVTHDQEEAMTMSDRISVMNSGRIEQLQSPSEIYASPKTRFVADFIGESNILKASVVDCDMEGNGHFSCSIGTVQGVSKAALTKGENVYICIRPESIHAFSSACEEAFLEGTVTDTICTGNLMKSVVRCNDGSELKYSYLAGDGGDKIGAKVYLGWKPDACCVMKD